MNEVTLALDRLNRHEAGESTEKVYPALGLGFGPLRDRESLSVAYRRECDTTPVDEAWALSVATKVVPIFKGYDSACYILGATKDGTQLKVWGDPWKTMECGWFTMDKPTRGEVRTVCRLFGIELKEPA